MAGRVSHRRYFVTDNTNNGFSSEGRGQRVRVFNQSEKKLLFLPGFVNIIKALLMFVTRLSITDSDLGMQLSPLRAAQAPSLTNIAPSPRTIKGSLLTLFNLERIRFNLPQALSILSQAEEHFRFHAEKCIICKATLISAPFLHPDQISNGCCFF